LQETYCQSDGFIKKIEGLHSDTIFKSASTLLQSKKDIVKLLGELNLSMLKKIGQTARYSEFKPLSDKLKKLEESINGQQGLLEGFVNKRKEFLGNLCEEVANYCSCVTKNITTSIESLDYMIKHYSVSSAPSHPLQASLLRTVIDKEKGWEPSLPRSHTTAQLKSVGNLTNEWSQQRTEYVNTETTGENQKYPRSNISPVPVYSRRSEYNINTSKKVPPIFTLGKFRETDRRDPSVHNGQPNINMACSTPPESSRLPNHYQESGVYTTASHKSIREELVRQLKGNFALEIDSLTESLQMTITVYSQKVAILEKRLHGIEEFIKSQTFISLTMRKRESATSLLEPIISKLQTNIATLSSQNKALQLK
jgi:hypothetical protein